jgi:hypothetical protein
MGHSKHSLFALLALLCTAVSGCTTTNLLSSDPQTAEDILRASTEHPARVTLKNGTTDTCFEIVVRKDTTTWRDLGEYVTVPDDSVSWITGDGMTVTLHNGTKIVCYDAEYGKDSTRWRLSEFGQEVSVPTDSVASIKIASDAVGSGILIGASVGALAVGSLAAATWAPGGLINPGQFWSVATGVIGGGFWGWHRWRSGWGQPRNDLDKSLKLRKKQA